MGQTTRAQAQSQELNPRRVASLQIGKPPDPRLSQAEEGSLAGSASREGAADASEKCLGSGFWHLLAACNLQALFFESKLPKRATAEIEPCHDEAAAPLCFRN